MAKYVCTGHRLDLSACGVAEVLTTGAVVELDPAVGAQLIGQGFPLSLPPETEEITEVRVTPEEGKE